jgi:hypothetical protein
LCKPKEYDFLDHLNLSLAVRLAITLPVGEVTQTLKLKIPSFDESTKTLLSKDGIRLQTDLFSKRSVSLIYLE